MVKAARRWHQPTHYQPGLSDEAERLNDVVDWFLTNEDGVRRHISGLLHALLVLGYTTSEGGAAANLEFEEGIEFCGLRNQTTFDIWRRLGAIRGSDGEINEDDMKTLLQQSADDLVETVIHLREYDATGDDMAQLMRLAEPIAVTLAERPNPLDAIAEFRARFEREVFNDPSRRHLGAIFIYKNLSEIKFYLLCWFYYCWYGRQFYAPPLP